MKYNDKDIYQALIEDEQDGIFAISLVDFPAVEKEFVCFKEQQELVRFSIDNAEKRNITGVVMLADVPIYRRNGDYEYYITYSRETIEKMANKLLKDGFQNQVSIMHNGQLINGITMNELYIKDKAKGIDPNFISDIPDGSLMATFHVDDEDLWDEIKNGDILKGFSLEGLFTVEKMNNNKINKNTNMSKIAKFVKSLMKFGEISTDKGILYWDGEGEIAVNIEVYVDGENDEKVIAADGEYRLDDERVIVVVDGKVSEIKEKDVEEPASETIVDEEVNAEEETVIVDEPQPEERDEKEERIASLEAKVSELESQIAELKEMVLKVVQTPASEPIVEEFEQTKPVSKTNKAARLFSHLNN